MDIVELEMPIEDESQIQIPNDVAVTLVSLGRIRDYIVQPLNDRGEAGDPTDVWERIEVITRHDYLASERHLRPETMFVADLGLD